MARRRRRGRGGNVWMVLAIIGLLSAVGVAAGAFVMLKMKAIDEGSLDAEYCPENGPASVTALLLDFTDPIAEITQVDLKRQFQRTVSEVPKGGLIEVYALTGDEGKLTRTFRGCNPGDGADADGWTSNPRKVQQRWDKAFNEPLKEILGKIGEGEDAKSSPIMAGIQRIVIESLSDPKADDKPKQLFVASDMLENTPAFSMYKQKAEFDAFSKSPARDRFRTPLDGIEVKFWAFQRETPFDPKDLATFWATWVEINRGMFVGYERLAGVK
jgi:hypothetical protein